MKHSGFTLVELLVAIVIMGILATATIPRFNLATTKAKCSEISIVAYTINQAQQIKFIETGFFAGHGGRTVSGANAIKDSLGIVVPDDLFKYYTRPARYDNELNIVFLHPVTRVGDIRASNWLLISAEGQVMMDDVYKRYLPIYAQSPILNAH